MYRLFWVILGAVLVSSTAWSLPGFQKGMSYTGWNRNALLGINSTLSIQNMKEIGIDWVAVTVFWFQDTETSTVITEDFSYYSVSRESVTQAIKDCHERGIQVMLKPHVDCRNGRWRGEIVPSAEWFSAYQDFIVEWAHFAEEHRVDMFSIGCEYVKTVGGRTWEPYWRQIAAEVRKAYSGPLTYAANHGNEQGILWWDEMDFIGIDAYYVLTNKLDPTEDELIDAWERRANSIETWLTRRWPGIAVIFTEIGYRSFNGANREPWEYSKRGDVDLQEQVDCYNAALKVLTQRPWFQGFYWWQWDPNPHSGGERHDGYTVQNKPAEAVLADWYLNRIESSAGVEEFFLY